MADLRGALRATYVLQWELVKTYPVRNVPNQNVPIVWSKCTHTKTYPPKRTYQNVPTKTYLGIYIRNLPNIPLDFLDQPLDIYIYIRTYIHTYIYTYIHIYMDVSVAEWLAWLTSNCWRIGDIGSIPSKLVRPVCQCVYVYVCIVNLIIQTIHRCSHTSIHTYILFNNVLNKKCQCLTDEV